MSLDSIKHLPPIPNGDAMKDKVDGWEDDRGEKIVKTIKTGYLKKADLHLLIIIHDLSINWRFSYDRVIEFLLDRNLSVAGFCH